MSMSKLHLLHIGQPEGRDSDAKRIHTLIRRNVRARANAAAARGARGHQ